MSEVESVPQWCIAKSGEVIDQAFLNWIAATKKKLLAAFPEHERAFCRIVDKMKSRLPKSWMRRLHYHRQKYFIVAPKVVFFGDFYFPEPHCLVEIDGGQHSGPAAREKDEWRSKLITAWKVKTVRISNTRVVSDDFRVIEEWLVDQLSASYSNPKVGGCLRRDYIAMRSKHQHIYSRPETLTTY